MINKMDKELKIGKMDQFTKEIGLMVIKMVMESFKNMMG